MKRLLGDESRPELEAIAEILLALRRAKTAAVPVEALSGLGVFVPLAEWNDLMREAFEKNHGAT